MRKHGFSIIYGLLLVAYTVYVLLDTFVITRVYTVVTPPASTSTTNPGTNTNNSGDSSGSNNSGGNGDNGGDNGGSSGENSSTDGFFTENVVVTANSYSDSNISITITEMRQYDTTIYVADVRVSSAEYLKTAFASNAYGRNVTQKTSAIAEANNAILAINGDYYGSRTRGYVLRNGVLYRSTATSSSQEDLVIWGDGSMTIITEGQTSAATLESQGAAQVLSFGPALINNGSVSVTTSDEVTQAMANNPRTAIGMIEPLHYILIVSDGRTSESQGLSLYELANVMQELGATVAYNLDGGGSSTMYFNGQIINNPTTNGSTIKERSVSDIVFIG